MKKTYLISHDFVSLEIYVLISEQRKITHQRRLIRVETINKYAKETSLPLPTPHAAKPNIL